MPRKKMEEKKLEEIRKEDRLVHAPIRPVPEGREGVILSILRLSRALRRCPPERRDSPFPPALGRMLACVREHDGVSSRELCELLDLRPSSLSEMLARAEAMGLLLRAADESDRRIARVRLTAQGQALVQERLQARREDEERKTACFTDEEAALFCHLSARLAEHLDTLAPARPPFGEGPCGRGPGPHGFDRPPFEAGGPRHPGRGHFGTELPPYEPEERHFPEEEEARHPANREADDADSSPSRLPEGARIHC